MLPMNIGTHGGAFVTIPGGMDDPEIDLRLDPPWAGSHSFTFGEPANPIRASCSGRPDFFPIDDFFPAYGGGYERVSSGQSLMTPHIESLPFQKRLALYTPLKGCVGGQNRRVDHPSVQQQIQERPLGIREGQHRG